jgi:hypothetical protein
VKNEKWKIALKRRDILKYDEALLKNQKYLQSVAELYTFATLFKTRVMNDG